MPGDFAEQAQKIATDKVRPALNRQFDELTAHRKRATGDAGVWKLPQGDAYYAWALSAGTTTHLTPDEIHRMGQEQLKELQSEMDGILHGLGLTAGTVGERMSALAKDKRYQFPEGDAGRAQIMQYLEGRIADMRTRLPRAFATLVSGKLEIKRLRTKARGELGGKFDLRLFDDALVKGGDVPMVVLARNIDAFIQKQKA
jgi:uncharacterized protein (DUF885 family)